MALIIDRAEHPYDDKMMEERRQTVVTLLDQFRDVRAPGRVVGTQLGQVIRRGIDKEGVISIDNGALRIQPLVKAGWGRASLAYGPYSRRHGLAFGAFLLNGHNISRTSPLPDDFLSRLWRWVLGSETERPLARLRHWIGSSQMRFMWRRGRQWIRTGTPFFKLPSLDENLAVGWFPTESSVDPTVQGNGIVVHAVVPDGGELWTRVGPRVLSALRGLQNVPVYYVIVLRERGAAYYASSITALPGLPAWPTMRLLAIDAHNSDKTVYAGIHQSVLGEIGFRVDTRVYAAQVAELPEFGEWYGSAHGADDLVGDGMLHQTAARVGGRWTVHEGALHRTAQGVSGMALWNLAALNLESPTGLLHVLIDVGECPEGVGVVWRLQDRDNFWYFEADGQQCRLSVKEGGRWSHFPAARGCGLAPNTVSSLQVLDDGKSMQLYLNGELAYGSALFDTRLGDSTGAGICVADGSNGTSWLRGFEAHPRSIEAPTSFSLGEIRLLDGKRVVVSDNFAGAPGDLSGRSTISGGKTWKRIIGHGQIEVTGNRSARVVGSVEQPCPGRTAYVVDWSSSRFADIEVTVTPPGTRKGLNETGRAGLILWQDPGNYLILSAFIGDFPAMSIAAFFQRDGFEELYDAVWSNVGKRMHWGVPHRFRVTFDSQSFMAFIDGEPVLYRKLSDVYPDWRELLIHRVGIGANWEWGNDTGSLFQEFMARDLG